MTDSLNKLLPPSRRERVYLTLIAAVLVGIVLLVALRPQATPEVAAPSTAPTVTQEPKVVVREVEKIVEVEKTVAVETLQDGLNEMGVLITAEYYFTDLVSYSSVLKLLKTDLSLPFTESSYLVSYDGVVNAGIDLTDARVEKDDARRRVTVRLPAATIRTTDIDLDSFTLHEEKTGLGNQLSVRDFNASLQELERSAEQKAVERGLLDKAEQNAKLVVTRFIAGLLDADYSLVFETL